METEQKKETRLSGQNQSNGVISNEKESQVTWKEMTVRQKWSFLSSNITVEPMLACYIMPSMLASLATQNLNLEKACRVNLAYDAETCDALSARNTANYTQAEVQVQQMVATMAAWKNVLQSALPAILIMFWGSWSDRRGCRKPCMLMPIVGEFLTCIGFIICTYYFYELPMEVGGVVEGLFPAITGGWFTMFMAVFSYVAEVSSKDTRTLRVGIVNVFCSLGVPFGVALSGVLYVQIGFYGIFSISAVLYVLSFFYGLYWIKETPKPVKNPSEGVTGFLKDFFDLKHITETFQVAFKDGENGRKKKVISIMIVVCVVIGPLYGEMAVMYLFTRYKFNWNEVDYSLFSTYSVVINLIGTMISVGLFSHVLKIDDGMIGVLSCSSKILSCLVYAFANSTFMFYMGPIVEVLNGTSFIAMRSMASKLVPPDELGKVNSLFGVCEALMPLVYGPMYSAVYSATLDRVPGAFFLLGGALTSPAVFIFLWLYFENKKDEKRAKNNELEAPKTVVCCVTEGTANLAFVNDIPLK